MLILVTGGLGYLGCHVVHLCVARGHDVRIFDNGLYGDAGWKHLRGPRVEWVRGELAALQKLPDLCEGVDAVIHLAGLANAPACEMDPEEAAIINIGATVSLADMARTSGARRFVFASSSSVYGDIHETIATEDAPLNPLSAYAATKARAERVLGGMSGKGFCPVFLRLGILFGWSLRMRFDIAVNGMILDAHTKACISVNGEGEQWRPFIHVRDAAEAFALAAEAASEDVCGEAFNVGSDMDNWTIEKLAHEVSHYFPNSKIRIGAGAGDPRSYRTNSHKIAKALGFTSTRTVGDGVREILEHLEEGSVESPESPRYSNIKTLQEKLETPAIEGGRPVRILFLPLVRPSIGDEEKEAALAALGSASLLRSAQADQFEERFREYVGAEHAIAVNSGPSGLHAALLAFGIGVGDEVITTPVASAATANAIVHSGATPTFADIDSFSLNIDVDQIAKKIGKKTKAIILMHMAGRPCDIERVHCLAKQHGIKVIEDAGHAVGSTYRHKLIGSYSDCTVFSFDPSSNLVAGEGGMLTTPHADIAQRLRLLCLGGIAQPPLQQNAEHGDMHFKVLEPGYKYNMTDIQAALGLAQLEKLHIFKARRMEIVQRYQIAFEGIPGLLLPPRSHGNSDICWCLFTIQLELEKLACSRDDFSRALTAENIGIGFYFISLHLHPWYRDSYALAARDFPNANLVSQRMLSIPLFPDMTTRDVETVVRAVKKLLKRYLISGDALKKIFENQFTMTEDHLF